MLSLKASKLAYMWLAEIAPLDTPSAKNPTLEPNMEWIGRPVAEIWLFEIFEMRGRSSVGRQYV